MPVIGASLRQQSPAAQAGEGRNGFGWNHLLGQGRLRGGADGWPSFQTRGPSARARSSPNKSDQPATLPPGPRTAGGLGSSNRSSSM